MSSSPTAAKRRNWFGISAVAVLGLILAGYGLWIYTRIQGDPAVVFLPEQAGAEWIVPDADVSLNTRPAGPTAGLFRVRFRASTTTAGGILRLRALSRATVFLDGREIASSHPAPANWKRSFTVTLPALAAGDHELAVLAQNTNGPVALWAAIESLPLQTGTTWEYRDGGGTWKPVRLAKARPRPALASEFPSVADGLASRWPFFAVILAATVGVTIFGRRHARVGVLVSNPAVWRWLVLGLWGGLGACSLFRVPFGAGFDIGGHHEYIDHVLNQKRIPFANEGWQMFQSPLYYVLSAQLVAIFVKFATVETTVMLLRLVPFFCGLLQIEVAYRAVRRVFPARPDLQIFSVVTAGALPMNLYLSRYVGNEPLAALLSSVAFLLCLRLVRPAEGESTRWIPLQLGVAFGLALLTKVSALLMGGAIFVALATPLAAGGSAPAVSLRRLSPILWTGGAALAIAGWYYLRNWIALGRPFVGGWDLSRGIIWWQDPGYRMAGDFFSFGEVFSRPVLAGLESVPGGLYASMWSDTFISSATFRSIAPAWDYSLMSASVGLALVPSLAIAIGLGVAVRRALQDCVALVTLVAIAAYALGIFHHIITVPYYCALKATYALGAMPAIVLLSAFGFDCAAKNKFIRKALFAGMACWAASALATYLVRA